MPNAIGRTGGWRGRRSMLAMAAASVALLGHAQAQGTGDPGQPVSDLYAALQAAMRMGVKTPFQQRFDRLAPVIDRVFDLDTILRTSVGLHWTSLDEASRRTLSAVFRTFTTATYTANFDKDDGQKFEVLPKPRSSGEDLIVASRLTPANGDPVRIDYLMRTGRAGWQIVDVLFNGSISRVAVQRSDFRALLASGSATPLIDSLRQKVADLSGGAMRP
jgi:phospholipid transport system substrate-binding protein